MSNNKMMFKTYDMLPTFSMNQTPQGLFTGFWKS